MLNNSNALPLIQAYANHGLVIDTNLLILDFVGNYDPLIIPKYKRTITYTVNDFFLLEALMKYFPRVIVNQPILTEAFNLVDSLNNIENYRLNRFLINRILKLSEVAFLNKDILGMNSFSKFGFADASLDLLSVNNLILTDDLKLYGYLSSQGKSVVNFNHIRNLN